jgi:type I restriction enzyme, S subunit
MNEWKEYKLGDFIEVINGYAFKSTDFLEELMPDSFPVIKIKNVANGDVHLNDCQYHYYNNLLEKFIVKQNDILIALTGNHPEVMTQVVGEVSRYKHSSWALLNQRVGKILTKENLNADFLYYFLKEDSIHDYLASQSAGSANQANISKKDIENIHVKLPPLDEQTAIANILSSLDDKIDLLHRQNKTLEALAETIFRQWFVEGAEESWEEKSLKDISIAITKGTTPTTLGKSFTESGINFIKAESITDDGGFIKDKFSFIDNDTDGLLKRSRIQEGDILISIAGTIGRVAYVTPDLLPANTNQAIGIIRVKKELLNPHFIYYLLKLPETIYDFEGRIVHAVQPNLSLGEIGNIVFKLPSRNILQDGMSQIERIVNKKFKNQTQIQTLTQLRDTLLPKLMSGEVRVI